MKNLTEKDLAYDRISESWETFISQYDVNRRVEVLVDDFLGEKEIKGRECLDAGCGLGHCSESILKYQPKNISACDISPKLVEKLTKKIPRINGFVANILELPQILQGKTFDVVVCSDVIEHTPDPQLATKKLTDAVCPGGLLSISVPNKRWRWLLGLAMAAGLRKNYEGHENYVHPKDLTRWIEAQGFVILKAEGVHTIPFKLFPKKWLRPLDQKLRNSNYFYAFNLAVLARKNSMKAF